MFDFSTSILLFLLKDIVIVETGHFFGGWGLPLLNKLWYLAWLFSDIFGILNGIKNNVKRKLKVKNKGDKKIIIEDKIIIKKNLKVKNKDDKKIIIKDKIILKMK